MLGSTLCQSSPHPLGYERLVTPGSEPRTGGWRLRLDRLRRIAPCSAISAANPLLFLASACFPVLQAHPLRKQASVPRGVASPDGASWGQPTAWQRRYARSPRRPSAAATSSCGPGAAGPSVARSCLALVWRGRRPCWQTREIAPGGSRRTIPGSRRSRAE